VDEGWLLELKSILNDGSNAMMIFSVELSHILFPFGSREMRFTVNGLDVENG
jgi:hypothetical protein